MTRKVSTWGRKKIQGFEGLRLKAYLDGGGVPTIGYGHTEGVKLGQVITIEQAEAFLEKDLAWAEAAVERQVKVPLTQHQFDALVSFVYNVGAGAFAKSTLLKKLNNGDYASVPRELLKWVHDNGKRIEGLVNRRNAEGGMWVKGSFVSSATVSAKPPPASVEVAKKAGPGLTGIGAAATVAAEKLAPLTASTPYIQYVFVALTLIGLALTVYASLKKDD